jgi:hypothetical protein
VSQPVETSITIADISGNMTPVPSDTSSAHMCKLHWSRVPASDAVRTFFCFYLIPMDARFNRCFRRLPLCANNTRLLLKHLNTRIIAFLLSDYSFVATKMVYRIMDADCGEWLGYRFCD